MRWEMSGMHKAVITDIDEAGRCAAGRREGEMNEEEREEYVVGKKWTTDLRERNNKKE